ncbi:MAG: Gfo/Idh/MocA family oxidoreductase [Clostridia bacterium]|nr:Gfo/Idh/MocA family oxidoreductase [Clostridia bacterium]
MYRVGILGTENSHAMAFGKILNGLDPAFKGLFEDFRVVAVGGIDPEASKKVADICGIDIIVERPEDMLGLVDAVMITCRDGKYHAPYALPFIKGGIPAFIDKPFTSDPEQALSLAKMAKEQGVPLVGGSSVKLTDAVLALKAVVDEHGSALVSGDMTAPVSMNNDYGNFWFYASHLAECCLTVFGNNPEWVWANRTAKGVTAVVHYPHFDVTNHFIEGVYDYAGTVITPRGTHYKTISLDDIYAKECACFADMVRNGAMSHTYEELVAPVYLMAAIEKSFETGEKVPVGTFSI